MAIATFAAGCFWHVEKTFSVLAGVRKTTAGYTGGKTSNPTYEQVCTGTTKHAEAVKIEYDETKITYDKLLELFWKCHDPTQADGQGPDMGTQYRSAIFYNTENQRRTAEKSRKEIQEEFNKAITTEITKASKFYPAEDYHQQYLKKKGLFTCPST